LTHSAAPSPAFEGGVKKRRSGSTLSPSAWARVEGKPRPSGRGVEGLTFYLSDWYIVPSSGATPYGVGWGGDPSDIPLTTNPALYN